MKINEIFFSIKNKRISIGILIINVLLLSLLQISQVQSYTLKKDINILHHARNNMIKTVNILEGGAQNILANQTKNKLRKLMRKKLGTDVDDDDDDDDNDLPNDSPINYKFKTKGTKAATNSILTLANHNVDCGTNSVLTNFHFNFKETKPQICRY